MMQKRNQVTPSTHAPKGRPTVWANLFGGRERRKAATLEEYRGVPGVESKMNALMGRRWPLVADLKAWARQTALLAPPSEKAWRRIRENLGILEPGWERAKEVRVGDKGEEEGGMVAVR